MKTALGWLLGIVIWAGMTLQTAALSILNIAATALIWLPYCGFQWLYKNSEFASALAGQAWPLMYVEALRPLAAFSMPLWIALWRWLTPGFAYQLNTPDDPDPATQGWGGTNKEPQVLWVLNHCGRFWCRVYWLQRNCLYGLAVKSKPFAIDVAKASYSFANGWLCARWQAQVGAFVFDRLVVERITGISIWPGRVLAFGADVHAYVDKLGPPLVRNGKPETDPTKDTGGVPCIKAMRRE
jgi:hypothetical protein